MIWNMNEVNQDSGKTFRRKKKTKITFPLLKIMYNYTGLLMYDLLIVTTQVTLATWQVISWQ